VSYESSSLTKDEIFRTGPATSRVRSRLRR